MATTELMTANREIELIRYLKLSAPGSKSYQRVLDELVLANQGLIHKVVHRFPIKNATCSYQDLFNEGVAGLIHGIQKFEVERGYRLSTYCYRWIQAYVSRYYQNHGKTIRIPVHMATKEMTARKAVESLTEELGRTPTQSEIAGAGINIKDTVSCTSLNKMIAENEELECLVGDDNTEANDYKLQCEMMLDRLSGIVSERDFNIFVHRYGLLNESEKTLNEISEFHGITRSRCHQVSNECLKLMATLK